MIISQKIILDLVILNLIQVILTVTTILLLSSCAPMENEEYPPRWVVASQYLPKEKLQGLRSAGFFEMNNSIYSHHSDKVGNMIRMKFDDENNTWKQIKYETLGCRE